MPWFTRQQALDVVDSGATVRRWNGASFRVLGKVGFERTERITTDDFGDIVWWTREL